MRDLMGDDGENRAVRSFLMVYNQPGMTVADVARHMRYSGWNGCWPEWVSEENHTHLTKAGAQQWLRHLFALESAPGVGGPEHG